MGEVFNALEVLNRTMKLGLSASDLMRAEGGFKSALARRGYPEAARLDMAAIAENYEVRAVLQKRAQPLSLGTLAALATKEIKSPRLRALAPELKKFDKALAAAPTVSPKEALKMVKGT
ncbi:MAG: hypothetical protein ACR2MO_08880 [Acidimicrobiales bacterium]